VGRYIGDVHVLPDGRFLVASTGAGIAAFRADGTPDVAFGNGGQMATTPVSPWQFVPLPDGRIVVLGHHSVGARTYIAAAAFFPDTGRLDPTFGSGGVALSEESYPIYNHLSGAVLTPDGQIAVVGHSETDDHSDWNHPLVLRNTLSADGRWGSNQFEPLFPYDTPGRRNEGNTRPVLTPDGRVVFVNFDTDTLRGLGQPVPVDPGTRLLFLQADGKFLLVGDRGGAVFVQRLLPDGSIDVTFGDGGEIRIAYSLRNVLLDVRFTGDRLLIGVRSTDDPSLWTSASDGWETRYVSIQVGHVGP
jgi:uncharacterized delta-60 repeat protein